MSHQALGQAFLGTLVHTPSRDQVECIHSALVLVDPVGAITAVLRPGDDGYSDNLEAHAQNSTLIRTPDGNFILPGLVDLHVHAPQWPQLGQALDVPLEVWLQKHTFPLEARYSDIAFARKSYEALVDTLVANGTTTAMYFATIHLPASQLLAEICLAKGQRALVGRVAMDDQRECPDFYRDASAEIATDETRAYIEFVRTLPGNESGRVMPVVTPRFIPACSDQLLENLGVVAREFECHVQTHCSESDWEHNFVLDRCGQSDTAALDGFGLLSRRTVLAHGNFLSDDDLARIASKGSAVAHCPLSNIYFSDAVFPLARALQKNVNVGLGTDISGGPSPSIFDNARQALHGGRFLETGVHSDISRSHRGRGDSRISPVTAFWLATAGGGSALDLPIGQFQTGFQFDAIILDPSAPGSNLLISGDEDPVTLVQKIIYAASRSNVSQTWIGGQLVFASRSLHSRAH